MTIRVRVRFRVRVGVRVRVTVMPIVRIMMAASTISIQDLHKSLPWPYYRVRGLEG